MSDQPTETITISRARFEELLEAEQTLRKLEDAGVDNWEGYSYAFSDDIEY